MHKKVPSVAWYFFRVINSSALRRNCIERRLRWANKEEAKMFAKKAEELGQLGMSYGACCDYLGWDVSIRREILAKQRQKAKNLAKRKYSCPKDCLW